MICENSVQLLAEQNFRQALTISWRSAAFADLSNAYPPLSDVEHENGGVCIAEVRLRQRSELLLASRVPTLQLHSHRLAPSANSKLVAEERHPYKKNNDLLHLL